MQGNGLIDYEASDWLPNLESDLNNLWREGTSNDPNEPYSTPDDTFPDYQIVDSTGRGDIINRLVEVSK